MTDITSGAVVPRARLRAAVEWPTLTLVVGVYLAFAALTACHRSLPTALVVVAGAVLIALHSSLQHELIHGHPTRLRRLNRALALPPLSLWLPFDSYRIAHLVHHRDDRLTDPLDDPESYYWTDEDWRRLSAVGRFLVRAQGTLLGRMLIGPFWNVARFLAVEAKAIRAGNGPSRRIWARHLMHLVPLVLWLVFVARMDMLFYIFGIVYPGTAILLIRSFAEHKAEHAVIQRTAIVERSYLLGPLFLFNNLHAAHHAKPTLPWYRIPAWYRAHRAQLVGANGGLVYRSYLDVARRYLLKPHDAPAHPLGRAPLGDGSPP
ncbi:Fatty acid desaturase [Kaistia soli DSM 19436]|uniref:Fatty acid desaturase n=1 Tax=Kaistia soli DSM 19436 TaxID=1122133 RepID=A0A1M4WY17_9HYPH|nr:fatty acid desaturase [Kaistia soli]SHE86057.1 Fatty acid desaturase [Kaistia soli DSM 19436]